MAHNFRTRACTENAFDSTLRVYRPRYNIISYYYCNLFHSSPRLGLVSLPCIFLFFAYRFSISGCIFLTYASDISNDGGNNYCYDGNRQLFRIIFSSPWTTTCMVYLAASQWYWHEISVVPIGFSKIHRKPRANMSSTCSTLFHTTF